MLLPLILYLDGTWLSANGSHSVKPWMMGIGNHPMHVQDRPGTKKVNVHYRNVKLTDK